MCKIKNDFSEKLLKDLRSLDKEEIKDFSEKANILARVKFMQDALEEYESILKKDLKVNLKEVVFIPEFEKKVYLSEGKTKSEIDNKLVYANMKTAGLDLEFFEIINIVKTKVDALENETISKIVEVYTKKENGDSYITVSKMNKKELLENRK